MNRLVSLFANLKPAKIADDNRETFSGIAITAAAGQHIACDSAGCPVILLQTGGTDRASAGVALKNLCVEHQVMCRIVQAHGQSVDGEYSLVRCTSTNASLQHYFLCIVESLLGTIPRQPKTEDISWAIQQLASLFLALQQPPTRSTQGLWAELFLIVNATDPKLLLRAWHSKVEERFDFSMNDEHIEVKSSGSHSRMHHFTLRQTYPPTGARAYAASVFVESQTNGRSLGDLWDRAKQHAGADSALQLKVERVCMGAVGENWETARSCSFNEKVARESLAFYDVAVIPKVPVDLPVGVSDVHFVSDLKQVNPIPPGSYPAESILRACPRIRHS